MSIQERREREKQQRRQTIMNAAIELIKAEGLAGLSMDKIAEKAELSKGTLYLYFKNKEQLLGELFWMKISVLLSKINEIMRHKGEFEKKVKQIIKTVVDFHIRNVDIFKTMYHSLPSGSVDFMQGVKRVEQEYKEKLAEMSYLFFSQYDKDQFYIKTKYLPMVLRGIIWCFLTEKIFGQSDIELDVDVIYRIFTRGVLK